MQDIDYRCSECGRQTPRDLLTVKKVSFLEMGENPKAIKTRTESWLCPDCINKDKAFNIPKGHAPGRTNFRAS